MPRMVFCDGAYLAEEEAKISIFDRGFLMGDAVYEVTTVLGGKLVEYHPHMERLKRSLSELEIPCPNSDEELLDVHRQLIARNNLEEGVVYLQISRGPAERDFAFPKLSKPTVVAFTQANNWLEAPFVSKGIRVISLSDKRWKRRDIKTTQILWSSMSKEQALRNNADDAWFVEDGFVTEGTASNAFIIKDDTIITRKLSDDILHGITRAVIVEFADKAGLKLIERPFTIEEAQSADEAFTTASPLFAAGVVSIDGKLVGNGKPGAKTKVLRDIHIAESLKRAV